MKKMRDGDIREMLGLEDTNETRYMDHEDMRMKRMDRSMPMNDEIHDPMEHYGYGAEAKQLKRKPTSTEDLLPFFEVDYSLLSQKYS